MIDLGVKIKDLYLKNPVMTASGTFGYGSAVFMKTHGLI